MKIKLQKPFKDFLKTLMYSVILVCVLSIIIFLAVKFTEIFVTLFLGLSIMFIVIGVLLDLFANIISKTRLKSQLCDRDYSNWKVFKIWFSENIIKIEKESKNAK